MKKVFIVLTLILLVSTTLFAATDRNQGIYVGGEFGMGELFDTYFTTGASLTFENAFNSFVDLQTSAGYIFMNKDGWHNIFRDCNIDSGYYIEALAGTNWEKDNGLKLFTRAGLRYAFNCDDRIIDEDRSHDLALTWKVGLKKDNDNRISYGAETFLSFYTEAEEPYIGFTFFGAYKLK